MIRAVLFDFYDTLAHLDADVITAGRQRLAERAQVDPAAMAVLWRDSAEQRMLGTAGSLEAQIRMFLTQLGSPAPDDLVHELAALEQQAWREAVALYPEARAALTALKARGYRVGILSNCSAQAGAAIDASGLGDLVDATALSFRLGVAKPQPAIYLHACEALGVRATETMFVADGAFGELDAARALGIVAVLIEQSHQSRAYGTSTAWDYRIASLAEVPALVEDARTRTCESRPGGP
jgi:putative hydrolase of the HAD superfamily